MTALADLLDDDARRKLLALLDEHQETDRIMRQPGENRPPDPPPALAVLPTKEGTS